MFSVERKAIVSRSGAYFKEERMPIMPELRSSCSLYVKYPLSFSYSLISSLRYVTEVDP